ncbi:MAG TPA: hypothetical protein VFT28_03035, partial [Gemmatimonadales bacterium]|nr:hypothetical protein [Gemmatimonadales bacterium]
MDLVGAKLTGLRFGAIGGRVTWMRAGRSPALDPSPAREEVWVRDDFPAGSTVLPESEAIVWLTPPTPVPSEPTLDTESTGTTPVRLSSSLERLTEELKTRPITAGQLATLHSKGLGEFIALMGAAIDEANDQVNFGYLRIQTAMYRLRQELVGDRLSGLVTSPVLAQLAQETRSSAELKKNVTEVFQQMKEEKLIGVEGRWWTKDTEVLLSAAAAAGAVRTGGRAKKGPPGAALLAGRIGAGVARPSPQTAVTIQPDRPAFVFPTEVFVPVTPGRPVTSFPGAGGLAGGIAGGAIGGVGGFPVDVGGGPFAPGAPKPPAGGGVVGGVRPETMFDPRTRVEGLPEFFRPRPERGGEAAPPERGAPDLIEESGPVLDKPLRTTSIADRIFEVRSVEAKDFAAATRKDIVAGMLTLEMRVDDLPVAGLALHEDSEEFVELSDSDKGTFKPVGPTGVRPLLQPGGMPARERRLRTLAEFRTPAMLARLTAGEPDPEEPANTQAAYFAVGSDLLNFTTALLRAVEGRVQEYRRIVERAQDALGQITASALLADRRLKEIEDALAEARHDVATDRALLAEERGRVDGINRRREAVLREHVTFVAYHRPRLTEPTQTAPARPLDPGPTPSPVPGCLSEDVPLPPELERYVALFRDAPASWFVSTPLLFDRFDRLDAIRDLVLVARERARVAVAPSAMAATAGSRLDRALGTVRAAQSEAVQALRVNRLAVDFSRLGLQTWAGIRQAAPELVELGDLIEGSHGRSDVARLAGAELDNIARVAGCLYRHFSEVLPAIRLRWAEAFSQYDTAISLRNLSVLSGWGEIDVLDRRELQGLVDWLFLRIRAIPAAVGLVNDLVRSCLLLASHSPVDQLVSGHVQQDTPVVVGGRVPITAISPAV